MRRMRCGLHGRTFTPAASSLRRAASRNVKMDSASMTSSPTASVAIASIGDLNSVSTPFLIIDPLEAAGDPDSLELCIGDAP